MALADLRLRGLLARRRRHQDIRSRRCPGPPGSATAPRSAAGRRPRAPAPRPRPRSAPAARPAPTRAPRRRGPATPGPRRHAPSGSYRSPGPPRGRAGCAGRGPGQGAAGRPGTTSAPGPDTDSATGPRPPRYGSPSSPSTKSRTSALGVPAAGYATSAGLRSGCAGSAIHHRCTGAVVDPGDQQPVRLRRPPEAARAAHLLGRDELRETVRDVRVLRLRRAPGPRRPPPPHPQCASRHVRDVPPVGRRPGVEHRAGYRQCARRTGPQLGDVQPSRRARTPPTRPPSPPRSRRSPRTPHGSARAAPAPAPTASPPNRPAASRGRRRPAPFGVPSAARSSTQSWLDRSVPEADRRKITRAPSGETVNARGAPRVNR